MRRRGFGYVLALTLGVVLLGSGGMLAFESAGNVQGGFERYGEALWWAAMLMTTIGSGYWPQTAEGRA
jgi:voltage-gated potassium channel